MAIGRDSNSGASGQRGARSFPGIARAGLVLFGDSDFVGIGYFFLLE